MMCLKKILKMGICLLLILSAPVYGYADENSNMQDINKKIVVKFYNLALNDKNYDAASHYLGNYYKQHNPTAADGAEGFRQFIHYLQENFPQSHSKIIQVFADGDFVILHVHSVRQPGTRGRAIVDIFKLKDKKIVEHWDVVQDIPEKSANNNSMF